MDKPLVIKQDINFLDKPLWFVEARHDGRGFVWKDVDGYEYRTGYNVPEKIDGLILLYLMWKSQKLGFQEKIVVTRYEVLKACDLLNGHSHYYKRLEESLKRWKNVALEFKGTFYDGKGYKSYLFGIIDEAKLRESDGQLEVEFNKSWLIKVRETRFFKYINFGYCKSLKRPVSMRLYELLAKNYKGRNECYFKLTTLGVKLTLAGRKIKTRTGEKEVIYASDVLVAIKPAINEINKVAMTPDIVKKTGIPPEDVFTLTYEIKGKKQDRIIYLRKHPVFPEKKSRAKKVEATVQPETVEGQSQALKEEAPHSISSGIASKTLASPESLPKLEAQESSPMDISTLPAISVITEKHPVPAIKLSQPVEHTPTAEAASDMPQKELIEALQWLNFIPYLRKEAVKEIASRPDFLKLYSAIRAEYERQKGKIDRPAGWVRKAFADGWQHIKTQKEEKKEVYEAIEKKIAQARAKVAAGAKYYRGEEIRAVFSDGLLVYQFKTLLWRNVNIDWLTESPYATPGQRSEKLQEACQSLEEKVAQAKAKIAAGAKYYRGEKIYGISDDGLLLREDRPILWQDVNIVLFTEAPDVSNTQI